MLTFDTHATRYSHVIYRYNIHAIVNDLNKELPLVWCVWGHCHGYRIEGLVRELTMSILFIKRVRVLTNGIT